MPSVCMGVYREQPCAVINAWSVRLFGEEQHLPSPLAERVQKVAARRLANGGASASRVEAAPAAEATGVQMR